MAEVLLDEPTNHLDLETVAWLEDLDVAKIDTAIDRMMPSLGFKPEDSDRPVASFSGGWQMRMALGKILLQDPDLLLLDEPTNHLDLETVAWLEEYLKGQEAPMVVVSHDREFLDNICTKIVETERGTATTYPGNYTDYVARKAEGIQAQKTAHERQQKEIARQVEMAQRLQGGGQAGRAEAAKKALAKLREEGTFIEKPFEFKKRPFSFPAGERCGQVVARLKGVTHGYGGRELFRDADLELDKGNRVALLGPNGAGKSTLLRLMMGTEEPLKGEARLGEHNIVPNYFTQNQAEDLDLGLTALETLVQAAPDAKLDDIKALLGRMLFSGSGMERKVGPSRAARRPSGPSRGPLCWPRTTDTSCGRWRTASWRCATSGWWTTKATTTSSCRRMTRRRRRRRSAWGRRSARTRRRSRPSPRCQRRRRRG